MHHVLMTRVKLEPFEILERRGGPVLELSTVLQRQLFQFRNVQSIQCRPVEVAEVSEERKVVTTDFEMY